MLVTVGVGAGVGVGDSVGVSDAVGASVGEAVGVSVKAIVGALVVVLLSRLPLQPATPVSPTTPILRNSRRRAIGELDAVSSPFDIVTVADGYSSIDKKRTAMFKLRTQSLEKHRVPAGDSNPVVRWTV